jgi:hypothetical protein
MKKVLSIFVLTFLLACLLTGCALAEPRPKVREGEFDFTVTYEYNGEIKSVSGVYVCAYNGMGWALDGGYYRDWTGYIQGGNTDDYVTIDTVDGDEIILVLNLVPDYFMDDYNMELYDVPAPYIQIKSYSEDGGMSVIYDPNEVKELCGARIISYEYDAPVQNSFSIFNFK